MMRQGRRQSEGTGKKPYNVNVHLQKLPQEAVAGYNFQAAAVRFRGFLLGVVRGEVGPVPSPNGSENF